MKLIPSEKNIYIVNFSPDITLQRLNKISARLYGNRFEFHVQLPYSQIYGHVNKYEEGSEVSIYIEMSILLKVFYILWMSFASFATLLTTIQCLVKWEFNWMPFIALAFPVFGFFFMFVLYASSAIHVLRDIKKALLIRK